MSSIKSLAKDTVLYGISHILPRLVNFIFVASFLSYTISKEEYGKFNTVYGYITAIIAIITFRMDTAYFRYANNEEKDRRDQVYSTTILPVFIIATIVLILLWVGAPNLDKVLDLNVGSHVIRWMSAVVWLDAFTTIMYSKYRLDRRPVKFLALRVLNVLIIVCLVMFFILAFRQYFPSLASQFDSFIGVKKSIDYVYLANLIASLMIFLAMVPDMLKIKYRIDKSLISKIFSYTWPLTVVSFAGVFNSYMTIPMVSYFSGGGEVGSANAGIYSAGLKLATLLNLFITAYNYAAEPFFFNQSKNADSKKIYGEATLVFTIIVCLVIVGLYSFIDLFALLIGPEVRSGIIVLPFLLFANVLLGLYYNVSMWYKLTDNTKIGLMISVGGMVITYLGCYILIPMIGILGASIATMMCYGFMLLLSYLQGQKHWPIDYPIRDLVIIISSAILVIVVQWYLRHFTNINANIRLGLAVLFFIGFTFYLYKRYVSSISTTLLQNLRKKK